MFHSSWPLPPVDPALRPEGGHSQPPKERPYETGISFLKVTVIGYFLTTTSWAIAQETSRVLRAVFG